MKITDYQIFFELRNKYPKQSKLIAELMGYAFQNHDVISKVNYLYLGSKYSQKDIELIFGELNLPTKDILEYRNRSQISTVVRLSY